LWKKKTTAASPTSVSSASSLPPLSPTVSLKNKGKKTGKVSFGASSGSDSEFNMNRQASGGSGSGSATSSLPSTPTGRSMSTFPQDPRWIVGGDTVSPLIHVRFNNLDDDRADVYIQRVARYAQQEGVLVFPAAYLPQEYGFSDKTNPKPSLRICVTREHTREQLEQAAKVIVSALIAVLENHGKLHGLRKSTQKRSKTKRVAVGNNVGRHHHKEEDVTEEEDVEEDEVGQDDGPYMRPKSTEESTDARQTATMTDVVEEERSRK